MAEATKSPNIGFIRPEVEKQLPKWQLIDDVIEGEDAIKSAGETYLPKPETHTDTIINDKIYTKYKKRAVFYPVTGRTLAGLKGQVFSKPVVIELESTLELLEKDVDGAGTTLEQQSKVALGNTLSKGRAGLLSDFPKVDPGQVVTKNDLETGRLRPRIIFYHPGQIINWRNTNFNGETKLSLLVLFENKILDSDGFEFKTSPRWRVYRLEEINNTYGVTVEVWKRRDDKKADSKEFVIDEEKTIILGANKQPLIEIPFSFIGASNNDSSVDDAPLYPLAQLNISHYRNSADYEQSLFIVGQPMPVFSGLTDEWVKKHIDNKVTLGSSTPVSLPVNSKAELLQAKPNSMPMEGMQHKEDQMKAIGAKLIEPGTVKRTATEATIEETSEASVLSSVAKNVSAAYTLAIYYCSLFIKEIDQDNIKVELNSEFQISSLSAQERAEVVAAWQAGVVAWSEVREIYRRANIAIEKDEEAKELIRNELIDFGGGGATSGDDD